MYRKSFYSPSIIFGNSLNKTLNHVNRNNINNKNNNKTLQHFTYFKTSPQVQCSFNHILLKNNYSSLNTQNKVNPSVSKQNPLPKNSNRQSHNNSLTQDTHSSQAVQVNKAITTLRIYSPQNMVKKSNRSIQNLGNQFGIVPALQVFHEMKAVELQPSIVTYNTLLMVCTKHKKQEDARHIFKELENHPVIQPNPLSFSLALSIINDPHIAHKSIQSFPDSIYVRRAILEHHKMHGNRELAIQSFAWIHKHKSVSDHQLKHRICLSNTIEEAIQIYHQYHYAAGMETHHHLFKLLDGSEKILSIFNHFEPSKLKKPKPWFYVFFLDILSRNINLNSKEQKELAKRIILEISSFLIDKVFSRYASNMDVLLVDEMMRSLNIPRSKAQWKSLSYYLRKTNNIPELINLLNEINHSIAESKEDENDNKPFLFIILSDLRNYFIQNECDQGLNKMNQLFPDQIKEN